MGVQMMNYIEPAVNEDTFTCPYCNTLASQKWATATFSKTINVF